MGHDGTLGKYARAHVTQRLARHDDFRRDYRATPPPFAQLATMGIAHLLNSIQVFD